MIATFCGNSIISSSDYDKLQQVLIEETEKLIIKGYSVFYLGDYGDFDLLCAKVLKNHKQSYPKIKLVFITPYINREYNNDLYDYSIYPDIETAPLKFAISKRNEWMIDESDIVLSYVKYNYGGSGKTLEYAKRKNKEIIYLSK